MSKIEKKSIVDLINSPAPEARQLERAVEKIHQSPSVLEKEKTVRVTVDTPESFHKELKRVIIDEAVDLKTFFLQAVREKLERLGKK